MVLVAEFARIQPSGRLNSGEFSYVVGPGGLRRGARLGLSFVAGSDTFTTIVRPARNPCPRSAYGRGFSTPAPTGGSSRVRRAKSYRDRVRAPRRQQGAGDPQHELH